MGIDISVFLEVKDNGGWTLVDVDPICSTHRNHTLLDALRQLNQSSLPSDVSKGTMYWFQNRSEHDHALKFLACIPLEQAAHLWWESKHLGKIEFNLESVMVSVFGVWGDDPSEFRVIVGWS